MTTPTNKKARSATSRISIPDRLYFRIGDVAELLGVKPHVLRYWESEFPVIAPQKSSSGQRVYRRSDVETLVMIKRLLHEERYSIEGARKRIRGLRKEGSLKSFKSKAVREEAVASEPFPEGSANEREPGSVNSLALSEVRDLALSVVELARKPLSDLFHF